MPTPDPAFLLLAWFTLAAALGAVTLRNLIHCALCAALAFVGIAMLFLRLGAEFIGLAQVLVYVGAVAILIVFAVLLVRGGDMKGGSRIMGRSWGLGLAVSLAVMVAMVLAILNSPSLWRAPAARATLTVRAIGDELMSTYVLPLEVLGLLLTAAVMGAAIIALRDSPAWPGNHASPSVPNKQGPDKAAVAGAATGLMPGAQAQSEPRPHPESEASK